MAAVDDLFTYLQSASLAGGATGWGLVRRRILDDGTSPDQQVVLSEDGGLPPEIGAVAGIGDSALKDAGVLITVRGQQWDGDASKSKALAILQALHGKRSEALVPAGQVYLAIRSMTAEPIFAGFDDKNRPLHTVALRLLSL